MGFQQTNQLTEKGKASIISICTAGGKNGGRNGVGKLQGNNGVLFRSTPDDTETFYKSTTTNRAGAEIKNNIQLAEALIDFYNTYGKKYNIDVNVLAAQALLESGFRIWVYPPTTTASGLCQFTQPTMWDFIITPRSSTNGIITSADRTYMKTGLISPDLITSWNSVAAGSTKVTKEIAYKNRKTIHQNFINNLDLMIRSQIGLMRDISLRQNNVAASTLLSYNQGSFLPPGGNRSQSYLEMLRRINERQQKEGSHYVKLVYQRLNQYFGYQIDLTEVGANSVEANLD